MDEKNDLVHSILNMHKSDKLFTIEMLRPSCRRQVTTNVRDKELSSHLVGQSSKELGTEYAQKYKQQDDEKYLQSTNNMLFMRNEHWDNMSDITASSEILRMTKMNTAQIYQTYNFAYRPKIELPILSMRNKIVSMIASNSVVVIRGSTGCGKTTQVPQLILDAEFQKKQHCNIIVTQPRRIAALSIAKRVSQEREWPVGTIVGYQMGLIKNICPDTRITYCTTGVLLHKLINKKHMLDYTHVILDEVHERDEDMDFLLLVIRKLLRTNSPLVKVILMSATIDVDKFAKYFSTPVENKLLPAPIIDIPNRNPYNISIYYLDDMENLGNIPEISRDGPKFTFYMAEFSARIIHIFDRIDKKSNNEDNPYDRPTVLVFLPGIQEIEDLRGVLSSEKNADLKWDIIILHSLISTEDQEAIFKKPPKGYRRIILSTNIAESSVTVPDVKYVIDFCMIKHLIIEPETNYQCLQLCWASKSNCQQRAGRTGRVMDGRVYRMVSREFYENTLRDDAIPEMLRIPLANVILKTKLLNMGEPKALLALSLDPPNLENLRSTILLLKEVGALLNRTNNAQEYDGDLTPLGHVMASLPLDIHLTKLIILGYIFGVLQDAIIIAASMSVREVFNINFNWRGSTYQQKLYWALNSDSDSFACLNAYKVWRNDKTQRRITNNNQEKQWAREKHLRLKSLREIDALINEIMGKLRNFGIKENVDKLTWDSLHVNRTLVVKVVIAGAFYPNYFVKRPNITERCKNIEKMLSSRDPMNTVILRGWPFNQPGPLYFKRFQEIFGQFLALKDKEDITVSFDGSSRIYLEYDNKNRVPNYCSFVQDCIKIRQCRIPIEIHLLSETEAHRRFKELGFSTNYGEKCVMLNSSNQQKPSSIQYMYIQKPYPELPKQNEYRTSVILQGPESPIEAEVVQLTKIGKIKTVSVESSSVNSVLFDTSPDRLSGLFLVAQTISQDRNMSRLILRNTTLLPNTPGLASLIPLIFTPYMELRRSPLGTYYTGALCGLGYDSSTGNGLFPEHDMEIIFDVEITKEDLGLINKLRHWMNVAMQFSDVTDNNYEDDNTLTEQTINCQNHIKHTFKKVIYKNRPMQQPTLTTKFDKWNRYDESLFLEPARETLRRSYVYGLHKALELNARNDTLEEEIKHLLDLETLAHKNPLETSIKPVFCKLCSTEICGIINLRAHLCSEQHTTKIKMIDTTTDFGQDLQSLLMKMRL